MTFFMSCIMFVLSAGPILAHQGEDHKKLSKAMLAASALIGQSQNALKEKDYFTTAEKLMQLAQTFKSLEKIRPPKGSRKEWNSIHDDVINAAFKAIGECAEKESKAVAVLWQDRFTTASASPRAGPRKASRLSQCPANGLQHLPGKQQEPSGTLRPRHRTIETGPYGKF